MAFFDFLGKDIGGYSGAVQAPATGMTGITYGDLSRAALQYGSKPGSSGAFFAGLPDIAGGQNYAPFGTAPTEQQWQAGMGQAEGQAGPPMAGQYRPPMTAGQTARMQAVSPAGAEFRKPRSSGQILSSLLPFLFGAPGG